jgi:alkylated DNA repair dioxygenase AlkB
MGWHRDNERNLGKFPVIASVSFGASRIFQFRNYKDKLPIVSIELTHGSLLIMKGETQHYWEHRLPKTVIETQPRINLTFRTIKT